MNHKTKYLFGAILLITSLFGCGGESVDKAGFSKSRNEVFLEDNLNKAAKAVERENLKELEELVKGGLNLNATGEHGYNLLYWAFRSEEVKSFEKLLQLGADPDLLWDGGYSVTYWAAASETDDYLKLALKYGANPNAINTRDQDTPIFKSFSAENMVNMKLLIASDANLNIQNRDGYTPILKAASMGQYGKVKYLIEQGADYCIENNFESNLFYFLDRDTRLMDPENHLYKLMLDVTNNVKPCAS